MIPVLEKYWWLKILSKMYLALQGKTGITREIKEELP